MTTLVGPVYVAHPYSAPSAQLRRTRERQAAALSTTINRLGAATVSPLQEQLGRADAFDEAGWRSHGLVLLRVCKAIVLPRVFGGSRGCVASLSEALDVLGLPVFLADQARVRLESEPRWVIEPGFVDWVGQQRRKP